VILPSVALKSRDAGHAILTDPAVGAHALDQLLIAGVRWDGLALDFEGLDAGDRADLTRFIQALGASLRDARKIYAVALPAKTADHRTGWSGAYDYAAIADAADLYLVMAYGFRTSGSATPGSTAPLRWVESSMAYAATQIAPERLILGVPFYGYDWNVSAGPPAQALRHSDTRQLLERTGATTTFDRETASATFRYELDGEQHEVWYEDDRALGAKLALVGKYGLRGAGAWRLGQEDPAVWTVWDQLLRLRGDSAGSPAAP
jgi:spore germination protein YaaH